MSDKWVYKTIPEKGLARGWFMEISDLGMDGWQVCGCMSGRIVLKKPATEADVAAVDRMRTEYAAAAVGVCWQSPTTTEGGK